MSKKNDPVNVNEAELNEMGVVEPTPPSDHTAENDPLRKKVSFGRTYYYVDLGRTRSDKGPNQLKGIIKWMIDHGVTDEGAALQGAEIGTRAVNDGYVVTAKLSGPVIFAYYIRRMEKEFGVEHAKTVHAKTGKRMH
jgi:hypothetical protein